MNKPSIRMKPALILILSILFSTTSFGQSAWSVINPTPPSDDYVDVQFLDDQTGYAVGQDGNIIKSFDSGITWNEIGSYISDNISAVFFHDTENGWIAGKEIYKTSDAGANWEYKFGLTESDFLSLFFISEQTGYAGNVSGNIYKTTDGGNSWNIIFGKYDWITKIFFINNLKGWATSRHNILLTDDGGSTWTEVNLTGYYEDINDFQFINENIGYVAARTGLLLKTTDSGISWDTIPLIIAGSEDFLGVHFFDENNGRVLSDEGFYITADGGLTWEEANIPYIYGYATSLYFSTENFGCIVGERIFITNDSGYNWEQPYSGHYLDQSAICFGNDDDVFITGQDGMIFKSLNNGANWSEIQTTTDKDLTDICFAGENILWVVGKNGKLLVSENYGDDWEVKDLGEWYDFHAVSFPTLQKGCVVGQYGDIYLTDDGGESWADVSLNSNTDLNDVFFINENIGWICGDDSLVLKTIDGGYNWQELNTNFDKNFTSIYFLDENNGWLTANGLILKTYNGGQTFEVDLISQLGELTFGRVNSIYFSDAMNGWAAGNSGLLLHTKDGGINWVKTERIINDKLYDIKFRNPHEGFSVGRNGYVLYTNQGTYLAPRIFNQPADTNICEYLTVSLECDVIGDSLNYQWLFFNEIIPSATTNPFIIDSISSNNGGIYSCIISNGAGSVRTDNFIISIKPNIEITGHPQNQLVYENDTVILNLAVTGALPINYQWQKNGIDIEGAIYNIYPIYGVQQSDSAFYRCIISNDCSVDTTNEAKLTVLPASSINDIKDGNTFSIVPNPVKSSCRILFDQKIDKGQYEIYSIIGEKIRSNQILHTKSFELDLSDLLPGIYLIRVMSGEKIYSTKFVKD